MLYASTIFLGAFLLFQVQPLIGKYILPWFGGSPAVWTTCMLFFQVLLLGGYAYSHAITTRLSSRTQVILHCVLLVCALATLPIAPGEGWKPDDASEPTWRILLMLLVSIGLPYFMLSTTGPLVQHWFSRAKPGASPYRLYALSNVGSLLALVSYPFLVEPNTSRTNQTIIWSVAFGVFVLLCAWTALTTHRRGGRGVATAVAAETRSAPVDAPDKAPTIRTRLLWLILPACASVLLLGVTNQITQDIAVIPFLWILPLSLYLLTFIICFDHDRWYVRPAFIVGVILCLIVMYWLQMLSMRADPLTQIASMFGFNTRSPEALRLLDIQTQIYVYSAALFICCMFCHGEVYRLKPSSSRLTSFYLHIAAGGALGGVFVAVVAPMIFKSYAELIVGMALVGVLLCLLLWWESEREPMYWAALMCAVVATGLYGWHTVSVSMARQSNTDLIDSSRNFYGVLRVYEKKANTTTYREMRHGRISHGLQFMDRDKRDWPTAYYGPQGGGGLSINNAPRRSNRRIGIVGLGAGTLATYGKPGDTFRFYEINDEVIRCAEQYFTYLSDSHAKIDIVLGDARLSMEREETQDYDVLLLDAFSSDSIPVHLLTIEAFELYRMHLKENGVIAVHITNGHIDLHPVLQLAAKQLDMEWAFIRSGEDPSRGIGPADWFLMTTNDLFFNFPDITSAIHPVDKVDGDVRLWTDDDTNLYRILK